MFHYNITDSFESLVQKTDNNGCFL